MTERLETVIRFLNRAEDLRTVADAAKDQATRSHFEKWADDCEREARRAIQSEAVSPPNPTEQNRR